MEQFAMTAKLEGMAKLLDAYSLLVAARQAFERVNKNEGIIFTDLEKKEALKEKENCEEVLKQIVELTK